MSNIIKNAGAVSNSTPLFGPFTLVSGAAATLLMTQDPKRNGMIICALATNTGPIQVGPSGVAAGTGIFLNPGDKLFIPANSSMYAYQNTGAAQVVTAMSLNSL